MFVPKPEATLLKQLGLNEKCFGYYKASDIVDGLSSYARKFYSYSYFDEHHFSADDYVLAPTWQQAFDWVLKEYNLYLAPQRLDTNKWCFMSNGYPDGLFDSYEEARLEALKQLIYLVSKKQQHETIN